MDVLDFQSRITTYLRDAEFRKRGFPNILPEVPGDQMALFEKTVGHFTRDRITRVGELFTEFLDVMNYLHWKDQLLDQFVNRFKTGGWDRIDEIERLRTVSVDFLRNHSAPPMLYDLLTYCSVCSRLAEQPMREVSSDTDRLIPRIRGPAQVIEVRHDITTFIAADQSTEEFLGLPSAPVVLFIIKDMDVPRTVHVLRFDDRTIPDLLSAAAPLDSFIGPESAKIVEQLRQMNQYKFIRWAGDIERR